MHTRDVLIPIRYSHSLKCPSVRLNVTSMIKMTVLLKIAGLLIAASPFVYFLYEWLSLGSERMNANIGFGIYVLPFLVLAVTSFGMLIFNVGKMLGQGRFSRKSDRSSD